MTRRRLGAFGLALALSFLGKGLAMPAEAQVELHAQERERTFSAIEIPEEPLKRHLLADQELVVWLPESVVLSAQEPGQADFVREEDGLHLRIVRRPVEPGASLIQTMEKLLDELRKELSIGEIASIRRLQLSSRAAIEVCASGADPAADPAAEPPGELRLLLVADESGDTYRALLLGSNSAEGEPLDAFLGLLLRDFSPLDGSAWSLALERVRSSLISDEATFDWDQRNRLFDQIARPEALYHAVLAKLTESLQHWNGDPFSPTSTGFDLDAPLEVWWSPEDMGGDETQSGARLSLRAIDSGRAVDSLLRIAARGNVESLTDGLLVVQILPFMPAALLALWEEERAQTSGESSASAEEESVQHRYVALARDSPAFEVLSELEIGEKRKPVWHLTRLEQQGERTILTRGEMLFEDLREAAGAMREEGSSSFDVDLSALLHRLADEKSATTGEKEEANSIPEGLRFAGHDTHRHQFEALGTRGEVAGGCLERAGSDARRAGRAAAARLPGLAQPQLRSRRPRRATENRVCNLPRGLEPGAGRPSG